MWHPLTLLLCWVGFALWLQSISALILLGPVTLLSLVLAGMFAARRTRTLLWRARWLFLSLAILFLFFTPGEYVPVLPSWLGLTHEGVLRAADQLGRLLALLASLALLHQQVGTQGLLAGLHALLRPFAWRDATVVRLMLVLELVEQQRAVPWREWLTPSTRDQDLPLREFSLSRYRMHGRDYLLIFGMTCMLGAWAFWS